MCSGLGRAGLGFAARLTTAWLVQVALKCACPVAEFQTEVDWTAVGKRRVLVLVLVLVQVLLVATRWLLAGSTRVAS